MEDRPFSVFLIVVVGIITGVGLVRLQHKDSQLWEIMRLQEEMLKAQHRMEGTLGLGDDSSAAAPDSGASSVQDQLARLTTKVDAISGLLAQQQPPQPADDFPPPEDLNKVYEIAAGDTPVRGPKDAPVTIVVFNDYQCPFSARFHPPVLEVLKMYPKHVRFMIKNFPLPFHPQAAPAAKAVMAAGEQGKYFEMSDALLADNSDLSEERFKKEAEKIGLNIKKFLKDYKEQDARWEQSLQKDKELAEKVNFEGTPTFYLNGRKTNARDIDSWKQEIDQILKNP
jgi:protein-disulfide isomerase